MLFMEKLFFQIYCTCVKTNDKQDKSDTVESNNLSVIFRDCCLQLGIEKENYLIYLPFMLLMHVFTTYYLIFKSQPLKLRDYQSTSVFPAFRPYYCCHHYDHQFCYYLYNSYCNCWMYCRGGCWLSEGSMLQRQTTKVLIN